MTVREHHKGEAGRDEHAYEENWYRVLKSLSLEEPIELGEVHDAEIAVLTFDPEVIHRVA